VESQKITKFLSILKIELEDLEADLQKLEELSHGRAQEGQITNFVLLENLTIIHKEVMGLSKIVDSMEQLPQGDYRDINEFADYFFDYCKNNRTNADIPNSVYEMFQRKINKVKQFVQD
jgi:hypothetical protein